jgi:hypothetical protein
MKYLSDGILNGTDPKPDGDILCFGISNNDLAPTFQAVTRQSKSVNKGRNRWSFSEPVASALQVRSRSVAAWCACKELHSEARTLGHSKLGPNRCSGAKIK